MTAVPEPSDALIAVRKFGYTMRVSREWALLHGLVEATPEEAARMAEERAEAQARSQRYAAAMGEWRKAVDAIDEPHWRATLDLHAADESSRCQGCDFDGYEGESPDWPCRTVDLIAEAAGLTKPEW